MNITILVTGFPPRYIGGTETQSHNIARELSRKNDVVVLTRRDNGLPPEERRDGFLIKRFRYFNIPVIRFFSHLISSLNEIRKIRNNTDILQCMMVMPNGLVGILAKKLFGIKTIAWVRGSDWYTGKRSIVSSRIIPYVIRNSDCVFVQTEGIKKDILNSVPGSRIVVMPNGIDPGNEKASGDNLIFVGRLEKVKGAEYLISAANELGMKTLIIGDGSERKMLEEMAGPNVKFIGRVLPDEVRKWMKKGDIIVLPSLQEGFPNVILEAMSLGIPVIATRVGGIPDIIKHGKTGFLVEPRNPHEIVRYVKKLQDKTLKRRMSENCRKEAKKYGWGSIILKLEGIYRSL